MSKIRYREFSHIDAIRAFAVMLVVFSHAGITFLPGGAGVTLFFVVSGFIITHLMLREHERTEGFAIGRFYLRRALKILPPLVVIVLLPTIWYGAGEKVDSTAVASQVFFGYNWFSIFNADASDLILPGSGVTWSLAIAEQFYIVFAIVWLILVSRGASKKLFLQISVVSVLMSTGWRIAVAVAGASELRIERGTDTRVDALATGVIVALIFAYWRSEKTWKSRLSMLGRPGTLLVAMLLFILSLLVRDEIFQSTGKYSFQQIAIALVILYGLIAGPGVVAAMFFRIMSFKPVQIIGLSSYSIYLAHLPVMYASVRGSPGRVKIRSVRSISISLPR